MMADAYARSFDLPVAILRPFNTYGPRQSERAVIPTIIRQVLDPACPAILIGDSTPLRDFTFVEDTVEAFLAIGAAPDVKFGRPYNAGSGRAVSVKDMIDLVIQLTKCRKLPVVGEPDRMRPAGSEVRVLLADSSLMRADTGWQVSIELPEGLERTISWWRKKLSEGKVRHEKVFASRSCADLNRNKARMDMSCPSDSIAVTTIVAPALSAAPSFPVSVRIDGCKHCTSLKCSRSSPQEALRSLANMRQRMARFIWSRKRRVP